jgi:hypothetical protein
MSKLQLTATSDQFQALHAALDGTRRTTQSIKVDRTALTNLLLDHSRALGVIGKDHYEEPT